MKILVCGSRKWDDRLKIAEVLSDLIYNGPGITAIIHGGATGADLLAARTAREYAIPTQEFRPNYDNYPAKVAPLKRNLEMLDQEPDLVLAFQVGQSRGTQHTINHARKRGIPVKVYHG